MQKSEKLQHFTGAKFVPTIDESPVSHGSHSRRRGNAWQYVASVKIPGGASEMCGCRIGAVGQESLSMKAIIVVLARFRDCGAIENAGKLKSEWRKLLVNSVWSEASTEFREPETNLPRT